MHQQHKPGSMSEEREGKQLKCLRRHCKGSMNRKTIQMFKEALQRAKRVAETTYSVVGIVEEFNITLAVMEAYLPGG